MLWFYPYSFRYTMTPAEVSELLRGALESQPKRFWVTATTDGVRIGRELDRWERGEFAPVFVGRFERSSKGTILKGCFRPSMWTIVWLLFLVGAYLHFIYGLRGALPAAPSPIDNYAFLWLLLGLSAFGWCYELPAEREILRKLKLSAGDGVDLANG